MSKTEEQLRDEQLLDVKRLDACIESTQVATEATLKLVEAFGLERDCTPHELAVVLAVLPDNCNMNHQDKVSLLKRFTQITTPAKDASPKETQ